MLLSLQIENFRCLRSLLGVPLRPLTILVGPNDSGKSAFLDGLRWLAGEFDTGVGDHWGQEVASQIYIKGANADGTWTERRTPDKKTNSDLRPVGFFQLPSKGVVMQSAGVPDSAGPPAIAEDGKNVAGVLDYLLRRERKRYLEVVQVLQKLVPGLQEVEPVHPDIASRRIDLVVDNDLRLRADQASAGVRLLIFFVALAYHPSPQKLILLEEPETGIHPKRLADVMGLLREITEGKHGGNAAQVILTTHSPYLLDCVDLDRDQVLVFRRNDDGSRTAEPADASRLKTFLDEFLLGEVWFNQGEEGLLAVHK